MAPEYAIGGLFSVKSDVFSFGILMLEILSGTRIRNLVSPEPYVNLAIHVIIFQSLILYRLLFCVIISDNVSVYGVQAWMLWVEDRPLDLIDEILKDSYNASQALRCIHIGLLCVQQHPQDRPNMSSVILMLGSDSELPHPKRPAIFKDGKKSQHGLAESSVETDFIPTLMTSDLSETR